MATDLVPEKITGQAGGGGHRDRHPEVELAAARERAGGEQEGHRG